MKHYQSRRRTGGRPLPRPDRTGLALSGVILIIAGIVLARLKDDLEYLLIAALAALPWGMLAFKIWFEKREGKHFSPNNFFWYRCLI